MNIIFIAPPSAGKGTQSAMLESKYNYAHISTGDLLRAEIKKESEIGKKIENIISKGELVSDDIIITLLKQQLQKISNKNFIIDGFPRNEAQAKELSSILNELNINNYKVIYLELDEETALKRALGRIICDECGATYNQYIETLMPKEKGYCDKCHGKLISRTDDNEFAMKQRYQSYMQYTKPVLEYYKKAGILVVIDASQDAESIFKEIERVIWPVENYKVSHRGFSFR